MRRFSCFIDFMMNFNLMWRTLDRAKPVLKGSSASRKSPNNFSSISFSLQIVSGGFMRLLNVTGDRACKTWSGIGFDGNWIRQEIGIVIQQNGHLSGVSFCLKTIWYSSATSLYDSEHCRMQRSRMFGWSTASPEEALRM
jgi:hypothetical protein